MTLDRNLLTGSQTFVRPAQFTTRDLRPVVTQDTPNALVQPEYIRPVPIKGKPGLYYGKVTFRGARGPFMQEGGLVAGGNSRQYGSLRSEKSPHSDRDYLILPITTNVTATPDPPATPSRMTSCFIFDKQLIAFLYASATTEIYQQDSTTGALSAVTGGSGVSIGTGVLCLGKIEAVGVSYFAMGHLTQKGGGQTLQLWSDLANPPTSTYIATGNDPIWGFVQLPDGTLMVYNLNRITMVDLKATAPAAAAWTDHRATVTEGGYMVGLVGMGGNPLECYIVVPKDGYTTPAGTSVLDFNPAVPGAYQGRLQRIDLRGWVVQDVEMDLPWVTYATPCRDGIMACAGGATHVFNNFRRRVRLDFGSDRATPSNLTLSCRGHYVDESGRFWWKASYLPTSGSATERWELFDFDLFDLTGVATSLPTGTDQTITGSGVQSVGGWDKPYSPKTRQLVDYAGGNWYGQLQPSPGELAYELRKTASTGTVLGATFENEVANLWPVLHYPGAENCPMVVARITGPANRHIATGHDAAGGYTTAAYVEVQEALSGVGARFHARGPSERRPSKAFHINRSWNYGFWPYVKLGRQTGGSDPTRYTPDGFPITYEFLIYDDGMGGPVPNEYRNLDASRFLAPSV